MPPSTTTCTATLDDHTEIRDEIRKLCAECLNEDWRKLDRDAANATAFVDKLTSAAYLAALIFEEYGGSGLPLSAAAAMLETIQSAG